MPWPRPRPGSCAPAGPTYTTTRTRSSAWRRRGRGSGGPGHGPSHIALTHATTDGMNVAAWAVDWKPGDRVVTTSLEHAGGLGPLWALRERGGVELVIADVGTAAIRSPSWRRSTGPSSQALGSSRSRTSPGNRRTPPDRRDRRASALSRRSRRRRRRSIGRGRPGFGRGARRRLLRHTRPEVAARARRHRCGLLRRVVLDRPRTTFAGYWSFESIDLAAKGKLWPDARRFEGSATTGHPLSAWLEARPGCRCSSGLAGSTSESPHGRRGCLDVGGCAKRRGADADRETWPVWSRSGLPAGSRQRP